MADPILKWVGGKRGLVPELLKHVPGALAGGATPLYAEHIDFNDYYEPFCGGAALFFAIDQAPVAYRRAHLNDANPHLINVYKQVRDNVEAVITRLELADNVCHDQGLSNAYYACRDLFNDGRIIDPINRAAYFIAMNAWGFNGLCRFNQSGGFNVPCGKFAKTPILGDKAENLRAASKALQGVSLSCTDFANAVAGAAKGDLVYFDPPYIPVNATSDFTSYTEGGFDMSHQRRLMATAVALVQRGVHVVLSNSDTEATRALYGTFALNHVIPQRVFDLHEVQARRAVNSDAKKRGKVGELIIVGRAA